MSFDPKKLQAAYNTYLNGVGGKVLSNQRKFKRYLNSDKFSDVIQDLLVEDALVGSTEDGSIAVSYTEVDNKILIDYGAMTYEFSDPSEAGALGDLSFYYNAILDKLSSFGLNVIDKPIDEEKMIKAIQKGKPIKIHVSFKHIVKGVKDKK